MSQFHQKAGHPMRMNTSGTVFAIFLGGLASLPPIATDMALPALGAIGRSLHAADSLAGLTLSIFMAGFAGSPIVYGPLADRYGRRPVLLGGLGLYTLGSIASAFAPTIGLLLLARLVQGAGAGSGMTIAMAMVRDLFTGKTAQGRLAVITVVSNLAPIVAPAMGAALAGLIGWRGIYGVTALCGVALLALVCFGLEETAHNLERDDEPLLPGLIHGYKTVLRHRGSMANIVVNALGFAWLFAYVAGSPLLIISVLHASTALYSAMFACTGAGIVAGAALSGRLSHIGFPPARLLLMAVCLALLATAALVALSLSPWLTLWSAMPLLVLSTAAFGIGAPNAAHGALDPQAEQAGIAGGLLTSIQMLFGAVSSTLVAILFPSFGVLALTGTMFGAAILALAITIPLARNASVAGMGSNDPLHA